MLTAAACAGERLLIGGLSGAVAQTLIYPLEVIQTRLAATHQQYTGIWNAAQQIRAAEGRLAFFRCALQGVRAASLGHQQPFSRAWHSCWLWRLAPAWRTLQGIEAPHVSLKPLSDFSPSL